MSKKEEIELLKKAIITLLTNDEFFTLSNWIINNKITCEKALKIALDRTQNLKRRQEYIDLWKFSKLINI